MSLLGFGNRNPVTSIGKGFQNPLLPKIPSQNTKTQGSSLINDNTNLKSKVNILESKVKNLESKVKILESKINRPTQSSISQTQAPVVVQPQLNYQTQKPESSQILKPVTQSSNSCTEQIKVNCEKKIDKNQINANDPITIAKQIMNGLILTLKSNDKKIDINKLCESIFAVCEKILENCNITKGSVNIQNLSSIYTCFNEFNKNILPKIINELDINPKNSQNIKTHLCKFKEQIICLLLVKDIKIKYTNLLENDNLNELLKNSSRLVLNEAKSYLSPNLGFSADFAIQFLQKQLDTIVNEAVKIIKPLLLKMEPLIEQIDSVQTVDINQNTVETAFNTLVTTMNAVKIGGKKTIKNRPRLYRRKKSSKSIKRV